MDLASIAMAIIILIIVYMIFNRFMNNEDYDQAENVNIGYNSNKQIVSVDIDEKIPKESVKEVVYTQDYYPWWRSTRWWNYDGWLYQKPYYNYWRRPYYYNYWYSGRPLIIGGKRYYNRQYW